ncbi:hypothetical protein C8Q74DRAFT_1227870 [Fomes fomentarius]|nr:hypothetical protein C8Q74DRAFT_1227870 [Fomes fomentarius]
MSQVDRSYLNQVPALTIAPQAGTSPPLLRILDSARQHDCVHRIRANTYARRCWSSRLAAVPGEPGRRAQTLSLSRVRLFQIRGHVSAPTV